MSDIGTPMTSTIPTVGTSGTSYATQINAFLAEVQGRLEAKIPISAVLVGSLDMGNNAIQNVSNLLLYPASGAPTTPTGSLQSFAGNLYWVNTAGAVQITNGTTVNAASVGGITGDYGGSNPAQLRFVDASNTYFAYDDFSTNTWAHFRARDFEIAGGATSANRVRLAYAGSADFTITLPSALPATQKLLQITAAGQLTASGVLAADESITLSGTGRILHGSRTKSSRLYDYTVTLGALSNAAYVADNPSWGASASTNFYVPLPPFEDINRILTVTLHHSNEIADPTVALFVENGGTTMGSSSIAGSISRSTNGGFRHTVFTVTTPTGFVEPYYHLKVTGPANTITYYKITTTFDTV